VCAVPNNNNNNNNNNNTFLKGIYNYVPEKNMFLGYTALQMFFIIIIIIIHLVFTHH
jgi:hypothetical protein